jgi:predicted GTPase
MGFAGVFRLYSVTVQTNYSFLLRFELFNNKHQKRMKNILLVGQTGAGKARLLNAIVNYLLGVRWSDQFRFQLLGDSDEQSAGAQGQSMTKIVTSYTIHWQPGFPKECDCSYTIIDTPGFLNSSKIDQV